MFLFFYIIRKGTIIFNEYIYIPSTFLIYKFNVLLKIKKISNNTTLNPKKNKINGHAKVGNRIGQGTLLFHLNLQGLKQWRNIPKKF